MCSELISQGSGPGDGSEALQKGKQLEGAQQEEVTTAVGNEGWV
jgi:hypothetical protein